MAVPSLSVSYSQHEIVWRWAEAAAAAATSLSTVPPSAAAAAASELAEEGQNQEKKKSAVALPWDFGSSSSYLGDGDIRRFDCSGWYSNWRGE